MKKKLATVGIFYKTNFNKNTNHYHAGGLAANALHTVAVLKEMGFHAYAYGVVDYQAIVHQLSLSHYDVAIIEAVWLKPGQVLDLAMHFPKTRIVIRAHSKIGFLQVEPEAIPVIREIIIMSVLQQNIAFCSNNLEFAQSLNEVYGPTLYLPNLYDFSSAPERSRQSGPLKIASFGATRLLKLHPNAALAALQVARQLMNRDLEFYINVDSTPGGDSVRRTIRNLFAGFAHAKLVEVTWQDAQTFKETIAKMDLVFQLSATETFCLVAADAVSSGVPVVVGPAITWVPAKYRVDVDNTSEAAAMAVQVLKNDKKVARQQRIALEGTIAEAKAVWVDYLQD